MSEDKTDRAKLNAYMREYRRRQRKKGRRMITITLEERHVKLIERYHRQMLAPTKQGALATILDQFLELRDSANTDRGAGTHVKE